MKRPKVFVIDIDGTICTNTEGAYEDAIPLSEAIENVNLLFDSGAEIVLFTARGSTTGIDWRSLTERQLDAWGVKYHRLQLGKPFGHYYIDDKALGAEILTNNPTELQKLLAD